MAERGIIFSAPMVRALLEGRKTQTRRLICAVVGAPRAGDVIVSWPADGVVRTGLTFRPPHLVGDRLYVREAFSYDYLDVDRDGTLPPWYWADGNPLSGDWSRPKPSIHMPRWASRLTLTVIDVRVQRLQEISEEDAIAEGIERDPEYPDLWKRGPLKGDQNKANITAFPRLAFRSIWESLHADPGTRWEDNPWIAAISFTVKHGNIDE